MYYAIHDKLTGELIAIGKTGSTLQIPLNDSIEDYRIFLSWYAAQDPPPFSLEPIHVIPPPKPLSRGELIGELTKLAPEVRQQIQDALQVEWIVDEATANPERFKAVLAGLEVEMKIDEGK